MSDMRIIETFTGSAKGDRTEDLIVETPHYIGVFDGTSGAKGDAPVEGKTLGQWGSALAGEALRDLPPGATLRDFADLATAKYAAFREKHNVTATGRLSSTAIILPRRGPLRVWSICDSAYGYKTANGAWTPRALGKYYDEVTHAQRRIVVLQELMALGGAAKTQEQMAQVAQAGWESMQPAIRKQLLFANYPGAEEPLGFGLISGTHIPDFYLKVFDLPEDTTEVVLCTDGLPFPTQTAEEGRALLSALRQEDPFLSGNNAHGFIGGKGGFVQMDGTLADWYDDVAYVRVAA